MCLDTSILHSLDLSLNSVHCYKGLTCIRVSSKAIKNNGNKTQTEYRNSKVNGLTKQKVANNTSHIHENAGQVSLAAPHPGSPQVQHLRLSPSLSSGLQAAAIRSTALTADKPLAPLTLSELSAIETKRDTCWLRRVAESQVSPVLKHRNCSPKSSDAHTEQLLVFPSCWQASVKKLYPPTYQKLVRVKAIPPAVPSAPGCLPTIDANKFLLKSSMAAASWTWSSMFMSSFTIPA